MREHQTIAVLTECIITEMERLQYAPLTIAEFRRSSRQFSAYAHQKHGTDIFTEELGAEYLRERIGFPFDEPHPLSSPEGSCIRCIRRLGEYKLFGALVRNRDTRKKAESEWALGDNTVISAFLESIQTADNSDATKKLRTHHVKLFYEFMAFQKIDGVRDMSAQVISNYALSLQGGSPVYAKHRLATLRYFFRFLNRNGFTERDWSFSVPMVIAPKHLNVPTLWDKSELELLLKSIDRGSLAGKRDYAIILLVIQLGLRIADVANLRFENLKWERSEIELIQHKTGNRITHPLLGDVGWAIIDYIKYARPKVSEPFVFLTINAPYTQMHSSSVGCILQRNIQRCGIQKKPGAVSGMHSLRHALARRLVEQGTPLSEIADIMGHTSYASTSPYLKVDIDGLRECALSLEWVTTND